MEKISFWFPVLYHGVLIHSSLSSQEAKINAIMVDGQEIEQIGKSEVSRVVSGIKNVQGLRLNDFNKQSGEIQYARVIKLNLTKPSYLASAFHEFLTERTDIDPLYLAELNQIIEETGDPCSYFARLIVISMSSDYSNNPSVIEELMDHLEELHALINKKGVKNIFNIAKKKLALKKQYPGVSLEIPEVLLGSKYKCDQKLRAIWERASERLFDDPHAFSPRTIDILSKMTAEDMLSFCNACEILLEDACGRKFIWEPHSGYIPGLFSYYDEGDDCFPRIRETGLLGQKGKSYLVGGIDSLPIKNMDGKALLIEEKDTSGNSEPFGYEYYPLTKAGEELLTISGVTPNPYFIVRLGAGLKLCYEDRYEIGVYKIDDQKYKPVIDRSENLIDTFDWNEPMNRRTGLHTFEHSNWEGNDDDMEIIETEEDETEE